MICIIIIKKLHRKQVQLPIVEERRALDKSLFILLLLPVFEYGVWGVWGVVFV
jgi:hypothetical protein